MNGAFPKVPRLTRDHGGHAFKDQRPAKWAGMIGFLAGRGYSSVAIAEALGDGTMPETIRAMITRRWKVVPPHTPGTPVEIVIGMRKRDRTGIEKRAAEHGLTTEEYCRRILVHGSMPKDRYREIVGDLFER